VTSWVLDASAVLAFLLDEPGAYKVRKCIAGGKWSAVNYAEVLTRLAELSGSLEGTRTRIDQLELELVPFDGDQAAMSASLRPITKEYGLSLADRACLALAVTSRTPVLTADQSWNKLDLGIEIMQIRQAA
jgi:PIN domain nuclease of toxin-antitoxin system